MEIVELKNKKNTVSENFHRVVLATVWNEKNQWT
jgi:hypothetical protein